MFKQQAGEAAAALVEPGMVVGLGTGSTAIFAIRRIAVRLHSGELSKVTAVATSLATASAARDLGICLCADDIPGEIDLTIDGADEVDPALDLIKGAGGALVREKIVAQASRRYVIVVDAGKCSPILGTGAAVPVEVLEFGWRSQVRYLAALGAQVTVRATGRRRFVSDNGNMILDCGFGVIADAASLAATLDARAGIVGHGLFVAMADDVFVAGASGLRCLRKTA